jgi:hypothetical protein
MNTIWLVYEHEPWEAPRLVGVYTLESDAQVRKAQAEELLKKFVNLGLRANLIYRLREVALNTPFNTEGEDWQDRICLEADPNGSLPHSLLGNTCAVCGHVVKDG